MSRCLLTGHMPTKREGVGEYTGKQYLVCSECAMTLGEVSALHELAEASADDIPSRPIAVTINNFRAWSNE